MLELLSCRLIMFLSTFFCLLYFLFFKKMDHRCATQRRQDLHSEHVLPSQCVWDVCGCGVQMRGCDLTMQLFIVCGSSQMAVLMLGRKAVCGVALIQTSLLSHSRIHYSGRGLKMGMSGGQVVSSCHCMHTMCRPATPCFKLFWMMDPLCYWGVLMLQLPNVAVISQDAPHHTQRFFVQPPWRSHSWEMWWDYIRFPSKHKKMSL